MKQVLLASTHSILSAQGEMIVPTGNYAKGLGSGVTVFEAFAAYGQNERRLRPTIAPEVFSAHA